MCGTHAFVYVWCIIDKEAKDLSLWNLFVVCLALSESLNSFMIFVSLCLSDSDWILNPLLQKH